MDPLGNVGDDDWGGVFLALRGFDWGSSVLLRIHFVEWIRMTVGGGGRREDGCPITNVGYDGRGHSVSMRVVGLGTDPSLSLRMTVRGGGTNVGRKMDA